MIKNHLKIALRNLWKERTFTTLNIAGLSIAFGIAILLSAYAVYELSYDNVPEGDRIYQLYHTEQSLTGPRDGISHPIPFAEAFQEEVPGIALISRHNAYGRLIINGDKQLEMNVAHVDPDFFELFDFPVVSGNSKNAISQERNLALTQEAAQRIFGTSAVVGKSVNVMENGLEVPYQITAVLENLSKQSSIKFDIAVNFKSQPSGDYATIADSWNNTNHEIFVKLAPGVETSQIEKASRDFTNLHYESDIINAKRDGIQPDANGQYIQQHLLSVKDLHFVTFSDGIIKVSRLYPYLVLGIAMLVLCIASINFINMSIAKSGKRLREIGMRKTLGAARNQLFFQFWGESLLVFIGSAIFGILIASASLNAFQTLFSTKASFSTLLNPLVFIGFSLVLILITLLAGGYPAYTMSRLRTLQALKGKLQVNKSRALRNTLLVVQFSIAILLISGTLVLYDQLKFMRTKDLGFNKAQVISIPLSGKKENDRTLQLLRNELQNEPDILNISASSNNLGVGKDHVSMSHVWGFDYKGKGIKTNYLSVAYDYTETLGLELVAGRDFNRDYAADSLGIVINEAMAQQLGEEDPLAVNIPANENENYVVIGVVKNFNFQDLKKNIEPLSMLLEPKESAYAYVKVSPQYLSASYDKIKSAWERIAPEAEFQGSFLDENIDRTLKRERNMTTMITSGSIIAIILSCIGLFAISLLVVNQRKKEIGIRKVVGASVTRISVLLSLDFIKLVAIAFCIAAPIAWWGAQTWLQDYLYRIDLNAWYFIGAGAIAVLIALLTISIRTISAALQNPINSLRTE